MRILKASRKPASFCHNKTLKLCMTNGIMNKKLKARSESIDRICSTSFYVGIGYCVIMIAFYTDFFYNVVIAWGFHFLYTSFSMTLPWASCNNSFNSEACYEPQSAVHMKVIMYLWLEVFCQKVNIESDSIEQNVVSITFHVIYAN